MTREEMKAELARLKSIQEDLSRKEADARTATSLFAKEIERQLLEEGGWKKGAEIKTKDGESRWIAWISFNQWSQQLVASCYRRLKSGKMSVRPDAAVILADLSMDKKETV